jgi:acyl-CoA synthetase (AMP-forming)/AMP-acid ligase II
MVSARSRDVQLKRRRTKPFVRRPLKLRIELVPKVLWKKNLRSDEALGKGRWDKLRAKRIKEHGSRCTICGAKSKRLHGHEVWDYREKKTVRIAVLLRVEIVCVDCHDIHHWARTTKLFKDQKISAERYRRPALETSRGRIQRTKWDAIALSYTSGTTGNPKGVVTHYRGAYLNAVSTILAANLGQHPVYLWTLPMFHCNGWCFPWALAATAGINVCLRKIEPAKIFELIVKHSVTHMAGAPIVYNTLINAPGAPTRSAARVVIGLIAGAAPPTAVLAGAENIGIELTHVYGLTEIYGPAALCAEQAGWHELSAEERSQLKRRQGVPLSSPGSRYGAGPGDHAARTAGQRIRWRSHVSRQYCDEGLSKKRKRHERSLCRRLVPYG